MDDVARYYDDNTSWFLRFDRSRSRVIHRPVWAPEARTFEEAAHYVHARIARALEDETPSRVLDLGCGVGATAFWLHDRLGARVHGVTISRKQVDLAEEEARVLGKSEACTFACRDFLDLGDVGHVDAAIAIESFVHAADPMRFFEEIARALGHGGRLFLCDDFLSGSPSPARTECIERFERGWRLRSLLERRRAIELADAAGFELVASEVLTPSLRLQQRPLLTALCHAGNALERAAAVLGKRRVGLVDNLIGGTALQQSQREGWTEYVLLELRRR